MKSQGVASTLGAQIKTGELDSPNNEGDLSE